MAELERKIIVSNAEMRPCVVFDKKALFHRWADKEECFLKINAFVSNEETQELLDKYKQHGYIPSGVTIEKIKKVVAIVEFMDGEIVEVSPLDVRFLSNEQSKKEKAEFACRVCHEIKKRDYPNAIGCPWRCIDNEYCDELKKIIEQEDTEQ